MATKAELDDLKNRIEIKRTQLGELERRLINGSMSLSVNEVRGIKTMHIGKQQEIADLKTKLRKLENE